MSSWKIAMNARYIEMKEQMKEMNDKLNHIVAFCTTFTVENEKPDKEKMNQMADIFCGRMYSCFKPKQKKLITETRNILEDRGRWLAGTFSRP
jgi:hypothetical protein